MEIVSGILLGLSTLLFIGPVFFYLLKSTVESGLKAGIAVAIGIIMGDLIFVILAFKGLGGLLQSRENSKWMALAGGLLLVGMGINYLFLQATKTDLRKKVKLKSLWNYGANGFLINFLNPFVIGIWVLFLTINESTFNNQASVLIAMITTLVVIFLTDLLKALFAHKLKKTMTLSRMNILYKVFGMVMILFGIRLILMFL